MAQPTLKELTLSTPDWCLLPDELLHVVSTHLENCFDVVHARSVCRLWRSIFPFPSWLLRTSYSLPSFVKLPRKRRGLCTLKKIPLFLFRVQTPPASTVVSLSEFFLGGIGRDESEDQAELPSPIQCSVKVKIGESNPTLMNMLDCQIFPLGHQYRMIGWDPGHWRQDYRGMAFLPLNEGRGGEFIVLLNYAKFLYVLRSAEMRWMRLKKFSVASCKDLITFRGRFYAIFMNGAIFVIDPYSLEVTPLLPPLEPLSSGSCEYMVPSGNNELFLVEKFLYYTSVSIFSPFALRVSRLDEEAGKWVVVTDLGDRVFFIGSFGNVCCSAKDLPDGCGVSGNSILFTNDPSGVITCFYKYGVDTGMPEDNFKFWRYSRETHVKTISTYPVVALQILPRIFARANGLLTRRGEIVLMNEKGKPYMARRFETKEIMLWRCYLSQRGGWRSFCHANRIRAGDFFTFKLIQRGETLVLRKSPSPTGSEEEEEDCSSESDEIESLSTESDSDE